MNTVANAAFNFGTSDFTVEAWVFPTSTAGTRPIVEIRTTGGANGFAFLSQSGATTLNVFTNSGFVGASTNSITTNQWNHVALVRSGNTWYYYINGQQSGSFSNSSTQSDGATTGPKIGGSTSAGEVWVGYLSNVRIVKGVAVYTGNFTPPTSPLTATQSAGTNIAAITGTQTSLLTCQSNRFIDNSVANSGAGFTITVNGSPSVQAFSPF
ncbi:LamG domain-containing protein, partial [bacterium]|nr:LamG domain-containing protein [bacterium]